MESSHYSALGVLPNASQDEIRTAYFSLARANPPEKDPELFERIRDAYRTLSNPASRADYDVMLRFGGEIEELLRQAGQAANGGRLHEAVRALRRVLSLNPGLDAARNRLGALLLEMGEYPEAIDVLKGLVKRCPDSSTYWVNLGVALCERARGYAKASQFYDAGLYRAEARSAFARAIELDLSDPLAYELTGWTYMNDGDYRRAIEWFKKAIGADSVVDLFDIDHLIAICYAGALGNLDTELRRAESRLIDILLTEGRELENYAAVRLSKLGFDILGSKLNAGFKLLCTARNLQISDKELKSIIDKAVVDIGARLELRQFANDRFMPEGLKAYLWCRVTSQLGIDVPNRALVEGRAEESAKKLKRQTITEQTERIGRIYPNIYVLIRADLERLRRADGGKVVEPPPVPILVAMALILIAIFVLVRG